MIICYWKDGCWVHLDELDTMAHRTDEYWEMYVDCSIDEHEIDAQVRDALL